ncbi:hypothetical protein JKP28_16705 [Vibrio vulnificus]|uniref:hypothetical protein n=1 Tax=Vibrio vulnificus TaxID=672 RepID=UPI001DF7F721|nr:hypothetical protein [Vibrio vulnificus]MCA3961680.1 hypothetical protein [Vibrio vulnificus]HDY7702079.1 hypothetical protein [Vibrio vulnificus]HDY7767369.1 hypothetical protein [Vibrio vulnificus]HDY7785472.1 hypothetical protein [Vibrio vulnificus]HDY7794634.1 hypothetical protein [Vibrio vulnificus]
MRFSSLRIFWITFISMFAMLSSSFASSAPLMTFQMLSTVQSQSTMTSNCGMSVKVIDPHAMHSGNHQSASFQAENNQAAKTPANHCATDAPSIHNCCTAACVSVFAFLPQTAHSLPVSYHMALIPRESTAWSIERQQSLYRPPIA